MKNRYRLIRKVTNLFSIVLMMLSVISVSVLSQISSVDAAEQAEDDAVAIALPEISGKHGDWISLAILGPVLAEEGEEPPAEETPKEKDACRDDDSKVEPGICGCGVADTDTDGDGVANCNENAGCTDPAATNYNSSATDEDSPCTYPVTLLGAVPAAVQSPLITAGIGHTCALTAKDGLECWGLNDSGQMGDGTFTNRLAPVNVLGIDPAAVISLVSGTKHTCVLTSANEVFCWGLNSSGQLGDGSTGNSNAPVSVGGLEGTITSISAGAEFTCALNSAGDVSCWGNNASGQLNDGTLDNSSTPVRSTAVSDAVLISGGSVELQGITSDGAMQLWNDEPFIPVTGIPETNNTFVSADRFTEGGCSMTSAGEVNCWGEITDADISGAVVSYMLASGEGHACTMKAEGLVCWGSNSNGQLGNGSLDDSDVDIPVEGLEQSIIALAAGEKHTCVIYEDETVACWGKNELGQLGNNSTDDSDLPVKTR